LGQPETELTVTPVPAVVSAKHLEASDLTLRYIVPLPVIDAMMAVNMLGKSAGR
jgi:hypothetical protein